MNAPSACLLLRRVFVMSVMIALALAICLKLHVLSLESSVLARRDPVFHFLSARQILLAAALGEMLVLAVLWRQRDALAAIEIIIWLAAVVWCYRLTAWVSGGGGTCSCMGALSDSHAWVPLALLTWMFVGGVSLLTWTWVSKPCTAGRR